MRRLAFLIVAAVLSVACENNDPTGPVVNNSGSENSFAFGDRAGGAVSAAAPPRPVITPVVQNPPTVIIEPRVVEDVCVEAAGTSTRRRVC